MIAFHLLREYWDWAGSNVGAMPACGLVAFFCAYGVRKPLKRWWHRHLSVQAELREVREIATAAHHIAADLHEKLTGERHALAPEEVPGRTSRSGVPGS